MENYTFSARLKAIDFERILKESEGYPVIFIDGGHSVLIAIRQEFLDQFYSEDRLFFGHEPQGSLSDHWGTRANRIVARPTLGGWYPEILQYPLENNYLEGYRFLISYESPEALEASLKVILQKQKLLRKRKVTVTFPKL